MLAVRRAAAMAKAPAVLAANARLHDGGPNHGHQDRRGYQRALLAAAGVGAGIGDRYEILVLARE